MFEKAASQRPGGPLRKAGPLLVAAMTLGLTAPAAQAVPANDARGFVDTIGVNVHSYYTDTAYGDFAAMKRRLQEVGIRHVRDGFDPSRRQWFYDRINSLGAAGIKSTLIACQLRNGTWYQLDEYVSDAKNKVRDSLDALEGVNEPDLSGSGWVEPTRGCQYWLNRLAKDGSYGSPLPRPILGPSPTGTTFTSMGDIEDRAQIANYHPYPGGQKPSGPDYYPFTRAFSEIRQSNFPGRAMPAQATETGYHDALSSPSGHRPIAQRAAAVYMPRLFLEYARRGLERTFAYELVDERPDPERDDLESNFGMFESDWSYKPSATALKNTIGLLDSPSAGPRTPLDYSLADTADPDGSGNRGAVKDMLFQKADGSWWMALWQDSTVWSDATKQDIVNPQVRVRIVLPRAMDVVAYRPTTGTGTWGSGRLQSFTAGVSDDVLLLKLTD